MTERRSATMTFLFTDLEGSTRLWEEHPEAMQRRPGPPRRDPARRDRVAPRRHVVKTTGDGFHAAFADAADAVDAAVDAQRALGAEPWPETGSVAGADGRAHRRGRAARRRLLRHRGEPRRPADGRRARRPGAGVAGDRGAGARRVPAASTLRRPRRAPAARPGRPEQVFQVSAPGLRAEFPPLRSLDRCPATCRCQVTSFVGREAELAPDRRRSCAVAGSSR